jgi:integrase
MAIRIKGLYKRGEIYWYQYAVHRGQKRISLKTTDLTEAIFKLKQIPKSTKLGCVEPVNDLIESFIATKLEQNRFTEATRRAAIVSLNNLAAYTRTIGLINISTKVLQTWFDEMRENTSEHTAQTHFNRARSFFRWARQNRLIAHNPTINVNIGRRPPCRSIPFATDQQRRQLIENVPDQRPDLKFILFAGFFAGMRKNEITDARETWFDLQRGSVTVPSRDGEFQSKSRRERTIPLAPSFFRFLNTYKVAAGNYMIGQRKIQRGAAIYRYNFRRPFEEYVKAQGIPWITTHSMRHTFASLLASKGESIYKIAVWLGDDVRTVQKHYAKLLPVTDTSRFE